MDGGTSASSRDGLETWLRSYLARISGLPPESIGSDDDFEQFAVDSETMVELVMEIEDRAGLHIDLSPELLFEHRTIRAVLDHIDGLRNPEGVQ